MALIRWALIALILWLLWRKLEPLLRGHVEPTSRGGSRSEHAGGQSGSDADRDPWGILGIDRNASQEEIRRAFHKRMGEYHPDRVQGLGPELRALADAKSKEISWAYQQLRRR